MRKRINRLLTTNIQEIKRHKKASKNRSFYRYHFFNKNGRHISKLLFGRCSVIDGAREVGWESKNQDFIVYIDTNVTRNEIRKFNKLSKSLNKNLFVKFTWTDKGIATLFATFILEKITEVIIKKMIDYFIDQAVKIVDYKVKETYSRTELELTADNDHIYRYIIENFDENQLKLVNQTIGVEYSIGNIKIYDKLGKERNYFEKGNKLDIKV